MPKEERPTFELLDAENNRLHAAWSRTGKRLILSVFRGRWEPMGQAELKPDQVEQLAAFLAESSIEAQRRSKPRR